MGPRLSQCKKKNKRLNTVNIGCVLLVFCLYFTFLCYVSSKKSIKPCRVLNMFLTFRHLKPYVLIWFVLIKKQRV